VLSGFSARRRRKSGRTIGWVDVAVKNGMGARDVLY
jgi:hypothetical protein